MIMIKNKKFLSYKGLQIIGGALMIGVLFASGYVTIHASDADISNNVYDDDIYYETPSTFHRSFDLSKGIVYDVDMRVRNGANTSRSANVTASLESNGEVGIAVPKQLL
ncbi:hypothetical protein [Methanococcoides burtonii]|uniref:Uncharacterized protein n=1 Tax=Methanococcoides burtonii (strain DSM 6242 / NBRC 107633 / OCM 468 / ACE-M) TaxID=259564 RepID=Q12Z76_METBU|nr:hypothetical protein [Methanococcoides burtonii]ABE51250.1 Hypothetical protein Mbur_0241 [Methanococcoides burtonii DSM 6242]